MIWRAERFNHACEIVSNIENIFSALKIHVAQKSEGHVPPHIYI